MNDGPVEDRLDEPIHPDAEDHAVTVPVEQAPSSFLFDSRVAFWKYILVVGLLGLVPSLALGGLLAAVGLLDEQNSPQLVPPGLEGVIGAVVVFNGLVLFSPLVETLMLAGILGLLSFFSRNRWSLAVASALIWGGLHSLAAPLWGLVVAWPFFLFSCGYLAWRERSWGHGFAAALFLHVFQNLLPGVILAIEVAAA